jgi:hypothetical protein
MNYGELDIDISPDTCTNRRHVPIKLKPGERTALGDLFSLWGLGDRSGGDVAILQEQVFSFLEDANASRDPVRIVQATLNARAAFDLLIKAGYPFQRIASLFSDEELTRSFRRAVVKRLLLGKIPKDRADQWVCKFSQLIDEGCWDNWREDFAQAETSLMRPQPGHAGLQALICSVEKMMLEHASGCRRI